jgi:hypothetical protein
MPDTAEHRRIAEITDEIGSWRRWGPYLSDRAWATVREDYSADGDAWRFLPHDLARSKAYRWGEDGIAGICDRYQLLCFAPAFWNGRDPILKERLFGLTAWEGNHGEDVKEYYFYLDNVPSHAYMKFLYKYPQAENARRNGQGFEFELLDTGVFDEDRYFDIVVEYAKATPEDIAIRITATNRGPEAAPLHILPHLWFRKTWGWDTSPGVAPQIGLGPSGPDGPCLVTDDPGIAALQTVPVIYNLGRRVLDAQYGATVLFTDNETNAPRVFGPGNVSHSAFVKDAFHRHVIHGEDCINPAQEGSKAALWYRFDAVKPGEPVVVRLRLSDRDPSGARPPIVDVDAIIEQRRIEADEFYAAIHPAGASADEKLIQRQAFAGLLWGKQSYLFDVNRWLDGDSPAWPPPASRQSIRNQHWRHLNSMRVMSVPDPWEYPWFAAWDLAFHCVALALIDAKFAKDQLYLLLFEQFQHPNGQIPAYEWEFSDLNPPVHAWAVWRVYNMDRIRSGKADRDFLEKCFHKLLMNFAWWVNKVDTEGNNVFEGGFLGLDNITVLDRSVRLAGGSLEQSDATGWMGMYCLNLMRIALELAKENSVYEALATKFFQHYVYIAAAMKHMGRDEIALWDERDGFFYDVVRRPDGSYRRLRVRSLVGLIPLYAVERLEVPWIEPFKDFKACLEWFLRVRKDLVKDVVHTVQQPNGKLTHVLTIVDRTQLGRMLWRLYDPAEFLSDYGIRSLSKVHDKEPFEYDGMLVGYEPAEAAAKIKGGNSNWRGPIWFPTCFLLIESLRKLAKAYGQDYGVPTPGSGEFPITFPAMARDLAERLIRIFTRGDDGRRAVYGGTAKFQNDPHWRDLILFYEYFHGDNGAGLGASHQTGWTALVASLIDEWREH